MIDFFFLFFQMESLGHLNRKIRRRRSRKCEFCFCSEWNVYSEWAEIVVCVDCCRGEDHEEGFWVGGVKIRRRRRRQRKREGKKKHYCRNERNNLLLLWSFTNVLPSMSKRKLLKFTSLDLTFLFLLLPWERRQYSLRKGSKRASKQYLFSFLFFSSSIYINVVPSVWLSLL